MKIIIFGASKAGQYLLNMLDKEKVETLCFVDNNKKLHNKLVNGYLVQHPSILLKSNFDYVVIASQFANEISKQLHEMGIEESKILSTDIYSYYNILCDKKNKILGSLFKNNIKSKPRIAIINFNNSKYQGKILYENIPASIQEKCEIKLITNINDSYDDFDIIVSSSLDGRYVPGKINYELWHGFPIKQIGALLDDSRSIDKFFAFRISKFVSMIFSYSKTYNHIFNASFFCDYKTFSITGLPRNDYLFEYNSQMKLEKLTDLNLSRKKIIFYLPTWRKSIYQVINTNSNSLLENYEEIKLLESFLEKNNILMFVKYHDGELIKELRESSNIKFITDEQLIDEDIHLYEVLGASDLIITDYSSVYLDTLLIDLPVIFYMPDYKDYFANKGFWMDNPELLMPGPKTYNVSQLIKEINELLLEGKDNYINDRKRIKNFIHYYHDNNSTQRVWNEIIKDLEEKNIL